MEIPILRHTRHFTIVNKPPLVYSQVNRAAPKFGRMSGPVQDKQLTLLDLLARSHPDLFPEKPDAPFTEPKLVHRLDYGVSGAMAVATSLQAARNFSKNLKLGGDKGWQLKKTYLAIVAPERNSPLRLGRIVSNPPEDIALKTDNSYISGTISRPLLFDKSPEPLEAVTKFEVLKFLGKGKILLALEPVTGRKHQLRRHCAYVLQAPIVGDVRYGADHYQTGGASQCIALHSWRLDFKTGLHWDTVRAPILWGVNDFWAGVVDPTTNEVYRNIWPGTPRTGTIRSDRVADSS
ncbi:pseudouridine synthase [Lipomyces doorenjongii]|uniref:pseudouridine synthase n=1 Tax=Lipomyces doorenjongii TaxID=383834 RepID=UPI0034CF8CEB